MQSRKSSPYAFMFTENHYFVTVICLILGALLLLQLEVFSSIESSSDYGHGLTTQQHSPANGTDRARNIRYSSHTATEIKAVITGYNQNQTVLNENSFEAFHNGSIVIVVQVHRRIEYLRHLIESLGKATNISKTLLIFSHDFYDEDINDKIQSIDFCKVMQIFYPHSIQTHVNEFPGEDPNDCPRDITRDKAILRQCNNALHPDLYGHYREAKFTQTKHHWWWKANRVFDQLEVTKYHTGLVLFLEEDHYVAQDFLYMLEMMQKRTSHMCPQCNTLSLGTYKKTQYLYEEYNGKVELVPWFSGHHNMGFTLTRSTWERIRECRNLFCHHDDYNWDWSLQEVSNKCLKNILYVMVVKGPRIFHIGECGIHHKKMRCDPMKALVKVHEVLDRVRELRRMYPTNIDVDLPRKKEQQIMKPNGGWGDKRDHDLCMNMTMR